MAKHLNDQLAQKRKAALSRKGITGAVMASIAVHGLLAIFGAIWIVARYIQSEPPKFVAPPVAKIKVPPQTRQHRMNLASHAALAAKPTFKARLVSLRPTAFALPDAPKVPIENMLTPDPSAIASNIVTGLSGAAGMGSGTGFGLGGAGGKGLGTGIDFMGIKTSGQRILLMFDVSGSVVNKANSTSMPLSKIKEETLEMINKLPVDSRFGIIQFVRNYKLFQPELIPATQPNRELAKQWIQNEWSESGSMPRNGRAVVAPEPNGLPPVLRAGYALKPDVVFLISDGSFERGSGGATESIKDDEFEDLFKDLTSALPTKIPFHFVGFQMKSDAKDFWNKISRRQGGQLKELK
jgi:hypothetical protein